MRDIGKIDGCATDLFDRQFVQVFDRRRQAVDLHDELLVAHLRIPGGQGQALGIDRVKDVVRGNTSGAKGVGVEVDHDLLIDAAIRGRHRDALNRRQRLAYPIEAVIVKLLFAQPIRTQA